MHFLWFSISFFILILKFNFGEQAFTNLDDLVNKNDDSLIERQLKGVIRDAIRGFIAESFKYLTTNKLIPSVKPFASSSSTSPSSSSSSSSSASNLQASGSAPLNFLTYLNPIPPITDAANQINQASQYLGNVFRTMRSNWIKRNQEQQQELRKRLAWVAKRLTNSKVIMGNLHRLTGREDDSQFINLIENIPNQSNVYTDYVNVPF